MIWMVRIASVSISVWFSVTNPTTFIGVDFLDEFSEEVLSQPPGSGAKSVESKAADNARLPSTAGTSLESKSAAEAPKKSTKEMATPGNEEQPDLDALEAEFASKLKFGMDSLMQEMNDSPETQKQFEAMLAEMAKSIDPSFEKSSMPSLTKNTSPKSANNNDKKSFQDTISQTMNRLNESKQEIDKSVLDSADDDFLAKMMKDLESAMGSGGAEGDLDMSKLINDMLEQMASKEILYEPMKEMHEKYPAWIKENLPKLSAEEKARYENQFQIITEVVTKFEKSDYSDDNPEHRKYITTRMELMQNSGAPPSDLLGNLAAGSIPGLDMDADGLPQVPGDMDNCAQQ